MTVSISGIHVPAGYIALAAIDAPYVQAAIGSTGSSSIFLRISLQRREEWPNGIFENSPNLHLCWSDDKLEAITRPYNMPAFRKCPATTPEEVVDKINRYIAKVKQ